MKSKRRRLFNDPDSRMAIISSTTVYLPICLGFIFFISSASCQSSSQVQADGVPSIIWHNNQSLEQINYPDGSLMRVVLSNSSGGVNYTFGFFRNNTANQFLSVLIFHNDSSSKPRVVWTANRDKAVGENAILQLQSDGNMVLTDYNNASVWSTNTSNAAKISLQRDGNLVLLGNAGQTVWKSFDHPTDALLLTQTLNASNKLRASSSASNYSEGLYYLQVEKTGLFLYAQAPDPQVYWRNTSQNTSNVLNDPYAQFNKGSLDLFLTSHSKPDIKISFPSSKPLQYLQINSKGKVEVYAWDNADWQMIFDLTSGVDNCSLPGTCGSYGLCNSGQCSCLNISTGNGSLVSDKFTSVYSEPDLGCNANVSLVCNSNDPSSNQHFVQMEDYDYPPLSYMNGSIASSIGDCQNLCKGNCSCKAAFFKTTNISRTCYTLTEVYTLKRLALNTYNSTALIRMQGSSSSIASPPTSSPPRSSPSKKKSKAGVIAGGIFVALFAVAILGFIIRRHKRLAAEEDMFELVPGLPCRFTYKELNRATQKFSRKIGTGGFGSVFHGILADGTPVAVKRLENGKQAHKEFRAEICTIGSIHHFNLVHLYGFCYGKGHRLLVYEYMPNGSLDHWLFGLDHGSLLDWESRFKIALGTARGLAYLHEECRETIVHLDIKPHNIMLDEKFEAKVSDFGLYKLVGRDQSQLVTQIRGTPSYLAPEATITSKTDVYSYGILLLEIVSGRKNVDLISIMNDPKLEIDIVDPRLGGVYNKDEATRAIKVAFWCIQEDPESRPTMGNVVQMLEGYVEMGTPPLNFLPHPKRSWEELFDASLTGSHNITYPSSESIPFASTPHSQ